MPVRRLYFNARNWELNKACPGNKGERCFISGISGGLEEVYLLGAGTEGRTEIITKPMLLEKDSMFRFCFWLKNGNYEDGNETCQLHVIFDGRTYEGNQYKLNSDYIAPLKVVKGWRLYDLPFETQGNSITQLKLVVERTAVIVMHAGDPEEYDRMQDDRLLTQDYEPEKPAAKIKRRNPFDFGPYNSTPNIEKSTINSFQNVHSMTQKELEATNIYEEIIKKLDEGCVHQQIVEDIVNQLVEQVEKSIDLNSLVQEFSASLDIAQLRDAIRNIIKDHIEKESKPI